MKRCPECRRDYYDDTLLYCLDDGTPLLNGPGASTTWAAGRNNSIFSEAPTIIGGSAAQHQFSDSDPLSRMSNSIAVLPFVNMSADPENEYLCDGLAEELLNALSRIDDLKVAARTSAFSFKGTKTSISSIGQTLGVQTILEGSVKKSRDRVRITVKLINAEDGYQIWSERFDRELDDIFAIEDEITLAVVESLKLKVFGEKREAIIKRYTNNAEAYQLYLMGRFQFNKFSEEGCIKAIDYFEQTLAIEEDYAPAYAGVAEVCGMQWYVGTYANPELIEREREAVARAIELAPGLAESYRSRALLRCYVDWDFVGAGEDYRKTLELNPNDALAHAWHALWLAAMGHKEKAVRSATRARELDPLSVNGSLMSGWAMWFSGQYDGALDTALACLELDPLCSDALRLQGNALWGLDDVQGARQALERSIAVEPRPLAYTSLCALLSMMGDEEGKNAQLTEILRLYELKRAPAVTVAYIFLALGEFDEAFRWFEKALENRDGEMLFMRAWPRWLNPVYDDPRFTDLLRRIGLPDQER